MDWSKLDAGLAAALDGPGDVDGSRRYVVFVHLGAGVPAERLADLGLEAATPSKVGTATLSAGEIDRLSEQAWVTGMRLSRSLRLPDPR